jgi:hypothetical protein
MRPQPKPLLNIFPHMNIIALCFVVELILIGKIKTCITLLYCVKIIPNLQTCFGQYENKMISFVSCLKTGANLELT